MAKLRGTRGGPNVTTDYDVKLTGPIFDGTISRAMRKVQREIEDAIGDEAVEMAHGYLDESLRHPTGYYKSRVQRRRGPDGMVVGDGGVIYGPWLEGVSSRNQETSFKGYKVMRRVQREIQAIVPTIVEEQLEPYLR